MSTINIEEKDSVAARWTTVEEKVFIELMVDQVKKGNRPTTTFSRKAWKEIEEKFYALTGTKYNHLQLKNKFNKLRTHYREFKKLRDVPTGFGWNPITKTVTAPPEVWDSFIKTNPYWKHFRTKGCPMFDELMVIYGDTTATGFNARASTQGSIDTDDDTGHENVDAHDDTIGLDEDSPYRVEDVTGDVLGNDDVEEVDPPSQDRIKNPKRRRKSFSKNDAFTEACKAFTINQQKKISSSSSNGQDDPYSIKVCCDLLSKVHEVDDETYLKALKAFKDRDWRETFVNIPEDKRLLFVRSF